MSGDDGFFARWSRRKRRAATPTRDRPPQDADRGVAPEAPAAAVPPGATVAPADPLHLPPIGSIDAGSDIRAFLAAGVPAEVARAALRRAWSADPAIRDFVGLSENSWDFTAPGGVPGFGSVTAAEARKLLGRLVGEPEAADPAPPAAAAASSDQPIAAMAGPAMPDSPRADAVGRQSGDPAPLAREHAALQHDAETAQPRVPPRQRGHGGALPK